VTGLLENGLVERLVARYPAVDVRSLVSDVQDMARRGRVRNPEGLLVTWVVRQHTLLEQDGARRRAQSARDQERYAILQVELFRLVAERGLGPSAIAGVLEAALGNGYPMLNRRAIARLQELGESWPAAP